MRRRIAERRTVLAINRLRPEEGLVWARRCRELAPAGPERLVSSWTEALALLAGGDYRAGGALLDRILAGGGERAAGDLGLWAFRGRARLYDDDVAGALDDLATAAAARRPLGSENMATAVIAGLARARIAAGEWDAAARDSAAALSLAAVVELPFARIEAHGVALALALLRGRLDAAEQHVTALRENVTTEQALAAKVVAAASLDAARGRSQAVLDGIDELRSAGVLDAVARLAEMRLPQLEADALIRLERLDEADALLAPHEARAAADGRRALAVELGRLRGRLEAARGDHAAAERAFAQALDGAAELPFPYELALAQLDRGRSLRRQGQRKEGAALLELARDRFAALGAAPALEQCERELAASGLTPARRVDADRSALTARERAVAQLAADGLANRAIAAELMVSVKTVEVHLSRVFAKLGIAARTELPGRL